MKLVKRLPGLWRLFEVSNENTPTLKRRGWLDVVEEVGNRLPDPALLFLFLLFAVWIFSWLLSGISYEFIDPRTQAPIEVNNLLTASALTTFTSGMVNTFIGFHPLGVVLVAIFVASLLLVVHLVLSSAS
mgnify:CR=1 FL=1